MSDLHSYLQQLIKQSGGQIPFSTFMDAVLYHPSFGYYNRDEMTFGEGGDFYTAPMVHPIFGQCVARQIREIWQTMGQPDDFAVIEIGAGDGTFALDMLQEWRNDPSFLQTITYFIVERSARLRQKQEEKLISLSYPVLWRRELRELPQYGSICGVFISNELFDALPVHRLRWEKGSWKELYVTCSEDRLIEISGPLSNPRLADIPGEEIYARLEDGHRLDVCPASASVIQEMANGLKMGCVLTFDYGSEQPDVYMRHLTRGGIRCYHRQKLSYDPYVRLGEQDLTADVDFTLLTRAGEQAGLQRVGFTTQGQFLARLGFLEKAEELGTRALGDWSADMELQKMLMLYLPHGLGEEVKVLIQCKGMGQPHFRGFFDR